MTNILRRFLIVLIFALAVLLSAFAVLMAGSWVAIAGHDATAARLLRGGAIGCLVLLALDLLLLVGSLGIYLLTKEEGEK